MSIADGRTRKPKHVLGKRKPDSFTHAGPCISIMPDGSEYLFKPNRKPKPGKVGVVKTESGYMLKTRDL